MSFNTTKKNKINSDKIAEIFIKVVGISTICSIGVILIFILFESFPLFYYFSSINIYEGREISDMYSLFWGTIKGSTISMLFSIPLGLAAAIYFSFFAYSSASKFLSEVIDFIAFIPTVVLGFIASICIAPYFCILFPYAVIILVSLFLSVFPALLLLDGLKKKLKGKISLTRLIIIISTLLSLALITICKDFAFIKDFSNWLFSSTEINFEQRNGLLVGFALGLSVTPFIFSLSKNAIKSVPKSYREGSYALGASQWQTITKVVLPNSINGILASILVAFGKASGETMILLMASGNTPIIEMNPFTGMRSISANIILEVVETQYHSNTYYFLFGCAALLMVFTFITNSLAELIKNRQIKKFKGYL